jgi:hypothetical protein
VCCLYLNCGKLQQACVSVIIRVIRIPLGVVTTGSSLKTARQWYIRMTPPKQTVGYASAT